MKELLDTLRRAGLKAEETNTDIITVYHPWSEGQADLGDSLSANRKTTSIARKFNPKSIEPAGGFNATIIRF